MIHHANTNQQKAGVTRLTPDQWNFRTSTAIDKEGHFLPIKGLSSWEDIAILYVYVPIKKASIHMKQKLIELKRKSKIKEKVWKAALVISERWGWSQGNPWDHQEQVYGRQETRTDSWTTSAFPGWTEEENLMKKTEKHLSGWQAEKESVWSWNVRKRASAGRAHSILSNAAERSTRHGKASGGFTARPTGDTGWDAPVVKWGQKPGCSRLISSRWGGGDNKHWLWF